MISTGKTFFCLQHWSRDFPAILFSKYLYIDQYCLEVCVPKCPIAIGSSLLIYFHWVFLVHTKYPLEKLEKQLKRSLAHNVGEVL